MSPANRQALDALKAKLPQRPREADLWDAMGVDERELRREKYPRLAMPVAAHRSWAFHSWRGQRAIERMCRPIIEEAEAVCAAGEVIGL